MICSVYDRVRRYVFRSVIVSLCIVEFVAFPTIVVHPSIHWIALHSASLGQHSVGYMDFAFSIHTPFIVYVEVQF